MTGSLPPLNPEEEAVVRALARAILVVPRALDADLSREQRMSLNEYSALQHLSEAPGRQMRMSELAAACDLSLSGMTRIVSRLEQPGYIVRERCVEDARGWNAVLTDAGLTRLEQAYPTQLASVRRHIVDHLEGLDLRQLATALQNLATTGICANHPDDGRVPPAPPSGPDDNRRAAPANGRATGLAANS
ncbi:MarR family winged helix-turn-helix transcriptional regulator [Plantactinospora sp. B5E13]|uniref:MarR family winged helix-turn-helix transcriptional regulator n=1 Tax=Plantactinospora sp. B5E13 TaxID=3153758 RepID=UPI00325ED578